MSLFDINNNGRISQKATIFSTFEEDG